MKFLKHMTLQGIVAEGQEILVFDNQLANVGWKITEINVMPNDPQSWSQVRFDPGVGGTVPVGILRLSTAPSQGAHIAWAKDQVVGVGTWQIGQLQQMINTDFLIVDELYIDNLSYSVVAGWDGTMAYQIKLDLYEISDYEQVSAVTKSRAQS